MNLGDPLILGNEIILVNLPKIWSIGMNYPEFKPVIYSSIQIPMLQILFRYFKKFSDFSFCDGFVLGLVKLVAGIGDDPLAIAQASGEF